MKVSHECRSYTRTPTLHTNVEVSHKCRVFTRMLTFQTNVEVSHKCRGFTRMSRFHPNVDRGFTRTLRCKGRGESGMAPWAPGEQNTEGPSKKLGLPCECMWTVHLGPGTRSQDQGLGTRTQALGTLGPGTRALGPLGPGTGYWDLGLQDPWALEPGPGA